PMRAIGRISYSWYLWHWPVLVLAPHLLGHPLGLAARLAAALLSAALAMLTLRLIENPLRFATPIRRSAKASLALGAGVTAVAVAVGQVLLGVVPVPVGHGPAAMPITITAAPQPAGSSIDAYDAVVRHTFAQAQAAVAAAVDVNIVPSNLDPPLTGMGVASKAFMDSGCMLAITEAIQPECASGDTASTTTVALIGDSQAAMWFPAFREAAEQRHWRLETLSKGACPVLDLHGANPFRRLIESFQHCEQWRAHIMDRLAAERPKLVVVSVFRGYGSDEKMTGFNSYDPTWIDGVSRLVRDLRNAGAKVLVLGPIPDPRVSVPFCLSANLEDATACELRKSTAVNEAGIAAESTATKASGGHYADLTDLFCTTDRCPVIVGNTLVFPDGGHVSFEYARLMSPVMGALADRALAET
ncbi:MAG: SGNH hydrolase domain-containing protein, partial [Actinomycetes bacterium]